MAGQELYAGLRVVGFSWKEEYDSNRRSTVSP